jgi:S1-C subfamily serine protease
VAGAQETGVVDIDVVLNGTERAAGTGMVLTSTGEVLTNRHVVDGETSISVTVPATGRTYAARVVGISTTTDVAVVQLENVSGLATVKTSSDTVDVGDAVGGVGNAGGTGILTAAA